jgi:rare lipoprotein A
LLNLILKIAKGRLFWVISLCSFFVISVLFAKIFLFANEPTTKSDTFDNKSDASLNIQKILENDVSEYFYYKQEGRTSWYGRKFHTRRTSSGERFDMYSLTVAHRFIPFETIIRVTNVDNGRTILARVTDRGPFVRSKILDLSYYAAKKLEALGNPKVKIEALLPDGNPSVEMSENYLFGYSYDYPLVCLPENNFQILAEFSDFDIAIEYYEQILEKFPDFFVYLLVPSNQSFELVREGKVRRYLIGFLPIKTAGASKEYFVRILE